MPRRTYILTILLLLFIFSLSCTSTQFFNTSTTSTDAATPTPADMVTPIPTRKSFSLGELPGLLIHATSGLPSTHQNIEISAPDWSSTEVLIPHPDGVAANPAWSPDGRYIAYTFFEMEKGLYNELRLFEYAADEDISLTPQHIDGAVDRLSWAPDERDLVFDLLQDSNGDRELYVINIETRTMLNLTNAPEAVDQDPAWSPAGDVIAFSSDRDGTFDIWTISPQGDNLENLTGSEEDAQRDIKPSWSPDGRKIAFYRFESPSASLWVMDADGSGQRMLLDLDNADYGETPVWSPDGEWVALSAGGTPTKDVWLVNPATGETRQASAEPGRYGYVSWAPDSTAIAYEEAIRTARETIVHLHALDGSHHYSWTLDSIIYYLLWSPVDTPPPTKK